MKEPEAGPVVTGKRPREEEDVSAASAPTAEVSASAAADNDKDDDDDDEDDGDVGPVDDMPVSHEIVLKDHAKVRLECAA
jgi:hypothetical protein